MNGQRPSATGRKFGTLLQVAAGVTVSAILLGTLELSCWLWLRAKAAPVGAWNPEHARDDSVSRALRYIHGNAAPLIQDLDLLWRNQPSTEKTARVNPRTFERDDTWTIKINSDGFRGPPELFKGRDDGIYRILCIGDSVTFGFNVDQDAPFAHRIEEALRRQHPGRRIEVINAGVVGWTWVQGLGFLQREGLSLHPNLIIIAHGINDQFWNARITDSEHIWLLRNPAIRRVQALNIALSRTSTYRVLASVAGGSDEQLPLSPACNSQVRETGACRRVSVAEIEATVREIRHITAAAGIDLLVLNLDFTESPAVAGSRAAAKADDIPFLDFVEHFKELRLREEYRRARDRGLTLARIPFSPGLRFGAQPQKGPVVLLRVLTPSLGSRVSAKGVDAARSDFEFDEAMFDDGTHGDEVARDRVYSVALRVPPNVRALRYQFYLDGMPEFEPLPPRPSSWFNRTIRFSGDSVAFVELFGERYLMVESIHPNAQGHEVIAARIVAQLERLPSFRAFLAS